MTELKGKTALVTGASRGIGAAAARALADAGVAVVLAARSTQETGAVAEEIRAGGGHAKAVACDVAEFAQVQAAIAKAEALTGTSRLDILVNNAGIIDPIAPLAEADPAAWGRL
ncbi:MAG: SDR family NAD(P)-dependent oxidoreductase, partial [Pseudomonadota bacterium]